MLYQRTLSPMPVLPRPLELLVGEPVSSAGYGPREMDKLAARVQKAVEELYYSRAEVPRPEKALTTEDTDEIKGPATD